MRTILVTGGGGYIGRYVVRQLLNFPDRYKLVLLHRGNNTEGLPLDERVRVVQVDITNFTPEDIQNLGKIDICIHLAWDDGFVHNSINHFLNLSSHFNFLVSLINSGTHHLCVSGSFREYGKVNGLVDQSKVVVPDTLYSLSKLSLFHALRIYCEKLPVCLQWVRPFTVYGDDEHNDSLFSKIIQWEKRGDRVFPFTLGEEEYDFIHVEEVAKQIVATISQNTVQGVIDCCTGQPKKLKDMVEYFLESNKFEIRPEYGAFPSRRYDSPVIYGDVTKIKKILSSCDLYK